MYSDLYVYMIYNLEIYMYAMVIKSLFLEISLFVFSINIIKLMKLYDHF